MDFLNKAAAAVSGDGAGRQQTEQGKEQQQTSSNSGFMGRLNGMAGGGAQGEKDEDILDKGVDFVQEKFMGAGDQSNETAAEQAKDEQISDFIRSKYKGATGSDFPIADKDKDYGNFK